MCRGRLTGLYETYIYIYTRLQRTRTIPLLNVYTDVSTATADVGVISLNFSRCEPTDPIGDDET